MREPAWSAFRYGDATESAAASLPERSVRCAQEDGVGLPPAPVPLPPLHLHWELLWALPALPSALSVLMTGGLDVVRGACSRRCFW